ncbi:hypothetical protein MMJ09_26935, partial [Bacillus vallismortis]|nr:hypothetical protein [Bacillus vallismortis]
DNNGILRISFQSDDDRKRAEECIEARAENETIYADRGGKYEKRQGAGFKRSNTHSR